jgi:4-amino-4-deoxy-L-arabinose transferase-like glycosyltransferase
MPTPALKTSPPASLPAWLGKRWGMVILIFAFALAVLPNLTVRSFAWEEGRNAELARDISVRGELITPFIYGQRWDQNPALLPRMIAGVAHLTGEVNEWSARLPAMTAVLLTALIVLQFTRHFASERAALFAAASFVFCPLLLRKLTIAEPDTIVTALVFGAFVVWWCGAKARIGAWRALASGALLATAAMAKGPQPIAYFALGIGGHLMARKKWGEFPELILALIIPAVAVFAWACVVYQPGDMPVWLDYMRLIPRTNIANYLIERGRFGGTLLLDLLPAILFTPFFWMQREESLNGEKRALMEMLFWYAGAATLALFFWSGANTRYAMPAAPAVAVIAGLAFDDLWQRRRLIVRLAITLLAGLMVYQFALVCIVMPIFAARFGASRIAGFAIAQAVGQSTPVFNVGGPNPNQLFYVSRPIRRISREEALHLKIPAWLVLAPWELAWIKSQHPDYIFGQAIQTSSGPGLIAVWIGPPQQ